ncbi:hypothetical protein I3842_16G108800 [Carya illinoinensis]|uniref:Uncharacterized protein n=1 Tax=Carya illinoinensis TaxID=32201 RepID=A0A922D5G2_CARIL|nr:hypothetical protein I3842_16G108800 [Carya illinoinensis]
MLLGGMDRFVQLRKLNLEYCEQLEKIEELPPNIEVVNARGCRSLKSFPEVSKRFEFNTSNKSRLHSIDLSGCSKMLVNVGSHVAAILRPENYFWDQSCGLLFPGNKIPNWFYHCTEISNSCSSVFIEVELLNPSVIKGILTCAVWETETSARSSDKLVANFIAVNHDGSCLGTIRRTISLMGSDHVWLAFYDLEPFTLAKGSLQLHFHCSSYYEPLVSMKRCGVHLVRNDEKNSNKRKRDDDDEKYYSMDDNLEDGDED